MVTHIRMKNNIPDYISCKYTAPIIIAGSLSRKNPPVSVVRSKAAGFIFSGTEAVLPQPSSFLSVSMIAGMS